MKRALGQSQTSPAQRRAAPVVLTIAGSDCSGGAGLQADLRTFTTLGVYGTSAVTCVVAENPARVESITPVSPASVAEQIQLVAEAFPIAAIKTGMLFQAKIIEAVERAIDSLLKQGVPLVIDPVMVASSGRPLLEPDGIERLCAFFARATLVTPNRDEATRLCFRPIQNEAELAHAAGALESRYGAAFLVKGGHMDSPHAVDILAMGGAIRRFSSPRLPGVDPHGTGCTYAAAITAALARGTALPRAIAQGKRFINRALRTRLTIGSYQLLNSLPPTSRPPNLV